MGRNLTHATWIWVYDLSKGTDPLADIFWMCEEDRQVKANLPVNWTGICAPVMLTGPITIISLADDGPKRVHRSIGGPKPWPEDEKIYITWDQVPQGIPSEHQAIGDAWIGEGRGLGAVPFVGTIMNAQYIACNSRWVNYLWYNQQRFVNWSIAALEGVSEQLHATSLMAVQNRLVIETTLAPDQGVCDVIGEECCTAIPMNSNGLQAKTAT
ncbi:hypothetical protein ABVT39_013537 [Epinephelus coioides]